MCLLDVAHVRHWRATCRAHHGLREKRLGGTAQVGARRRQAVQRAQLELIDDVTECESWEVGKMHRHHDSTTQFSGGITLHSRVSVDDAKARLE